MELTFEADVWRYREDGGWHFVTLPIDVADEIRDQVPAGRGFGSRRVTASIGETTWSTSVFPDKQSGSFLLPVKDQVRRANDVADGDRVAVRLVVEPTPG